MKLHRKALASAASLGMLWGLAGCPLDHTPIPGLSIETLSNRADLVSGGQVLVELKLPATLSLADLKIELGSANVSAAFAKRADGRTVGLVSGLALGSNTLKATSVNGSHVGATLTITNAPKGGPVLLGSQMTPFVCATPTAVAEAGSIPGSNASGLTTVATDAQCNIATEFKLFYRTTTVGCSTALPDPSLPAALPTNNCFKPYTVGTTPTDLANTTTLAGVTMPYIVRVERGTMNRGIYDIAVLFNPVTGWTANAPQSQWSRKVVYNFGFSTGQPRRQYRSSQNWADDAALSRGFMVVDNSMTDSAYNSNRVLVSETLMMMKEHITENYGEILFTMGNGCSGGSINQNTAASIYPGLLDGTQVACDYPDSISTGIEVTDCVLLVNAYAGPAWTGLMAGKTQAEIDAKKGAINGHQNQLACHAWNNAFGFNGKAGNYVPTLVINAAGAMAPSGASRNNCQLPAALVWDAGSNPTGHRCGDSDASAAVWGKTTNGARALTTNDNVGVQYGLKALLAGSITAEEFVTINERVGGVDVDGNAIATRSTADAAALPIAYRSGILTHGSNLGKVATIDQRGPDENGIHMQWRSFSQRARIVAANGSAGSQVIWRFPGALFTPPSVGMSLTSLLTMNEWLTALATSAPKLSLNAPRTQAQIIAGKPASAFDFCYLSTDTFTTKVTNAATCDADPALKPMTSPHQVAGGPVTEDILKCELKALNFADYGAVIFSNAQQTRLSTVFSTGVCDWSKPGVGQQAPVSPLSFAAGPGGVALPAAPKSTPL